MTTNMKKITTLTVCVVLLSVVLICIRFLPEKKDKIMDDTQSINIVNEQINNVNSVNIINNYGEYSVIKNKENKLEVSGLEKYPRDENNYDELADKVSNLSADKIVNSENSHLDIYGLDNPQAQINISYNNNLNFEILIGNQAPGEIGYYMIQKDKPQVYLISSDSVSPFLKSKLDYISLSVTAPISSDETMKNLEYIELLGGNRPEKIKIVKEKSKDKFVYKITEPVNKGISKEGTEIIDSIENIFAQKIEMINVTQEDINKYRFDNPFATLKLKYKNKNMINIIISQIPDSEDFFVMRTDYNIIYRVAKYNLEWADISIEKLTGEQETEDVIEDVINEDE